MGEEEDVTSDESIQKRRFRENLEEAKEFLETLQPGIAFDPKGGIVSDGPSRMRFAEELRKAGFWTSTVAKLCRLKPANQPKADEDVQLLRDIEGPVTKAAGYKEEFKELIRKQVGRSRELTEFCTDMGLGVLLASLGKADMSMEDFRKIALKGEGLREALTGAGETSFKALEYYQSDLIGRVEEERDEARVEYILLTSEMRKLSEQMEALAKIVDPSNRLVQMIHSYLLSGQSDEKVLSTLIGKWLGLETDRLVNDYVKTLNNSLDKWR